MQLRQSVNPNAATKSIRENMRSGGGRFEKVSFSQYQNHPATDREVNK
jgi:hypothetical protein